MRFLFDDFVPDPDRRELTRGSQAIDFGPQVFDLLVYLVQNRHRVVSKDALLEAIWGGRIVSESTLTRHINETAKSESPSSTVEDGLRLHPVGRRPRKRTPPFDVALKRAVRNGHKMRYILMRDEILSRWERRHWHLRSRR